jgi:putative protease
MDARERPRGAGRARCTGSAAPSDASDGPAPPNSSCAPAWAWCSTRATPRTSASPAGRSSASSVRRTAGGSASAAGTRPRASRPGTRVGHLRSGARARGRAQRSPRDEPEGRIALELIVRGAAGAPLEVRGALRVTRRRARAASSSLSARGAGSTRRCCARSSGRSAARRSDSSALDLAGSPRAAPAGVGAEGAAPRARRRRCCRRSSADRARDRRVRRASRRGAREPRDVPRAGARPRTATRAAVRTTSSSKRRSPRACARSSSTGWSSSGLARAVERARARRAARDARDRARAEARREGYDRASPRSRPTRMLVRHWGALVHFQARARRRRRAAAAARRLLAQRHQLDHRARAASSGPRHADAVARPRRAQLRALLAATPRRASRSSLHHRIPTFHTEHCVYSHLLSQRPRLPHLRPAVRAAPVALRDHKAASTR